MRFGKKKMIQDGGVVEQRDILGPIVVVISAILIVGLITLGVLAFVFA